nr:3-oxoacyl-ACP reductase family protein [uncultured Anaeromusa sp.]
MSMLELQDKVAIVTGGNQGIGRATALRLAEAGAVVVIAARNQERNQQTVVEIEQRFNRKAAAFAVDVSDRKAVESLVEKVIEEFGHIDVLVNNAGICRLSQPFEELEDEAWDAVLDVNVKGVLHCVRAVIPLFKAQKAGKIVNVASLAGEVGGIATAADYVASKAAVIGLTKSLARYLGPYQVNVNAVAPGFIRTSMTETMKIDVEGIPLRSIGEAEDVAEAICFLASQRSRYITGTTLDVNGGLYMK